MRYLLFLLLVLTHFTLAGQYISNVTTPDTSVPVVTDTADISVLLANTITSEDLSAHLTVLASDEYEGRETGERGNNLAASYIAQYFQSIGLPKKGMENTYFQNVAFNKTQWTKNDLKVNAKGFKHLWDYLCFPTLNEHNSYYTPEEIIFLGFGIDDENYSDYKGNNLKGKAIMINEGEPVNKQGTSFLTKSADVSEWSTDIYKKLKVAKDHGVEHVFVISDDVKKFLGENRKYLVSPSLELGDGQHKSAFANHTYISSAIAREMIGKKARKIRRWRKKNTKKGKACDIKLTPQIEYIMDKNIDVIAGKNVVGFIEGTDKKNEVVIISAHYDHLGKRGNDVYNGADDNGSGTSTVLEIAEAFQKAKDLGQGPRRSVMCLLVTGEEKGLLGSKFYSENPMYPIENTVVNVNIDMVGRVDKKYENNPNYIYVIGSDRLSTDLHKINENINQKYSQLTLDYKYNDENDPNRYYYRSDHYSFASKGIPAIFFFNGTHEDYHRTSDTVEKINFQKMEKLGRHFFHTAWELANRAERIVVDGVVEEG